ncbi:non-ribosomal peptide synthetase [Paenibacillus lentus]|uniref:Amino acid adenylation domain-containing protein n=1 Tax=Paenibacillus lentus TaxID=1338368 RepID=A0A3S8S0J1_9BACL|nr:non-ribosomal peptide synthetase [Paenibacillus lentus]AZK48667.1 amino acid adenylation domain-containing protein [Paenibacillus lentus]
MFNPSNVKDIYSLSPMQRGMLFHYMKDHASRAYFDQTSFQITGALDNKALELSFKEIIRKYDILRTVFVYTKVKEPMQVVLKEREAAIHFEDISNLEPAAQEAYLQNYKETDRNRGFELSRDVLMRLSVFQLSSVRYHLLISTHHIIMDGWCLGILFKELFDLYHLQITGSPYPTEPAVPYSRYIQWLEEQDEEEARQFWQVYLENVGEASILPQRLAEATDRQDIVKSTFSFDKELTDSLQNLAKSCQVTLSTLFQTMWGVLLQKYTNCNEALFGAVISGRSPEIPEVEKIVGIFINTVPVRIQATRGMTVRQLLGQVQEFSVLTDKYGYLTLADLQELTGSSKRLVEHIVAFENVPTSADSPVVESIETGQADDTGEISIQSLEDDHEQTHYDLSVQVQLVEKLMVKLSYNSAVYTAESIALVFGHLVTIAQQIINDPDILIQDISIVTAEERQQLLFEFNDFHIELPEGQTVHELFEQQVLSTPEKQAVVFNGNSLTYGELNQEANKVARMIRSHGVLPNEIVALMVEHCLEMIIGVLGILKAGAAYMPIDPSYPVQRVEYMLEDSRTAYLLMTPQLRAPVSFGGTAIMLEKAAWDGYSEENVEPVHQSEDLAYVIYTSGSTGQPKGVMIEHRALVNLCVWHNQAFNMTSDDRCTKLAGFGFDASVWETFPSLTRGAALHILDESIRGDIYALQNYFETNGITVSFLPTQLAAQFMELDNRSLRLLLIGGDRANHMTSQRYLVVNNYGPTENTVVTTSGVLDAEDRRLPIGKPVANHRVCILDLSGHLQPVGVPGELCVSGEGLARGYLNQPALTAERFIQHPLLPGERMYRTGDLARWLPDGTIEYLGRSDEQVKIRGYRIEPAEIDFKLLQHPAVREALTIAQNDAKGDTYLCSYIVVSEKWTIPELRKHLIQTLPEYMVPAHFMELAELPLTANGKVDRRALPQPMIQSERVYMAPRTETEEKLAALFAEVLGVPAVGIDDHFFELGGHSLKAMTLVSRIHKEMDVEIPLNDVFLHATVREMADLLSQAESSGFQSIPLAPIQKYYPVSFAQRRMYVVQQMTDTEMTSYNIPLLFEIKGELDVQQLQSSLEKLVQRHEVLRTSFHMKDGNLVQEIHSEVRTPLEIIHTTEQHLKAELEGFIRPFKLTEAPLFRVGLVETEMDRKIFVLDMHHIISDGVSTNVLLSELFLLYQNEELPFQRLQYKDYAVWQQAPEKQAQLQQQEQYWQNQFADNLPTLDLFTDYPRPSIQDFAGDQWTFQLDAELLRQIRTFCHDQGITLYMFLLATYQLLLSKYTGQKDIVVGSPIAGRPHADLERVVGMFVNTLALRGKLEPGQSFTAYLSQMKDVVLEAYANSEYPFEQIVEKLNLSRNLGRHPLFDTMLSLQNMEVSALRIPNLEISSFDMGWCQAKFDLNWMIAEGEESLHFTIEYSTSLFKEETIKRMGVHFAHLISQVIAQPNRSLESIELATVEDQRSIREISGDYSSYPRRRTLHSLFESQVKKRPDSVALIMGDQQLTYHELNERANQLARILRRKGVQPDQVVGLMTERSFDMIVAILAIFKAGGAYMPIDPSYPDERINYMLEDSHAPLLLVQHSGLLRAELDHAGEILILSEVQAEGESGQNLRPVAKADNLAYVMYTSGSTGQPKGVMTTHRNVVRTVVNNGYLDITPEDRLLQLSNYAFDGSTFDIYGALIHGATLVLVSREEMLDPSKLVHLIRKEGITVTFMTTALFNTLVDLDLEGLERLRKLVFGGEQASVKHVQKALDKLGEGRLVNGYGPTETTVFAATWTVDQSVHESGIVPIGWPLNNTVIHIVDAAGRLQPIGVAGELCVSGDGVARGYLNRPELTAERFVPNPWEPGTMMYRTGDLARWLPGGTIEYLGRMDQQVKIRGHRIELGEIEAKLLEHPVVRETVLIARQDGQGHSSLCAYVVTDGDWTAAELHRHLASSLPEYMIPSSFTGLPQLPLTSNGKVDKRALPEPEVGVQIQRDRVAPSDETEAALLDMVADAMGIDSKKLSMTDNLFELGAHSLTILKILGKSYAMNWELEMKDFYTYSSLGEIAQKIREQDDAAAKQAMRLETDSFQFSEPVKVPVVPVVKKDHQLQHVLLIGVTGFLGIHMLYELLSSTTAAVTCLVRGSDEEDALGRVKDKLKFYFAGSSSLSFSEEWFNRVIVQKGDITQDQFGLEDSEIIALGAKVDTVIHTAALVKHYGFYDEFEQINVHGTRRVAEFCKAYDIPLHYVSTLSVAGTTVMGKEELQIFTEKDFYIGQDYRSNVYLRSKFEAEAVLMEGLEQNLDVFIYRVGNLSGRYVDGWFQKNIAENMFYLTLKALIALEGGDAEFLQGLVDLTQIDICAKAIITIMQSEKITDRVFHLSNPHLVTYGDIYKAFEKFGFKQHENTYEQLREKLLQFQSLDEEKQLLAGIITTLLDQGDQQSKPNVYVDNSSTLRLLEEIGFEYPVPDSRYLNMFAAYTIKTGFIKQEQGTAT